MCVNACGLSNTVSGVYESNDSSFEGSVQTLHDFLGQAVHETEIHTC